MYKKLKISIIISALITASLTMTSCSVLPGAILGMYSSYNLLPVPGNFFASLGLNSGDYQNTEPNKSIESTYINENGELVVIYSDGNEENLGRVVGQNGIDGKDGVDGADGKDGQTQSGSSENPSNSIAQAVSIGLKSSVSVICTYGSNGGFGNDSYGSAGSGVIYSINKQNGSAFIITNHHVVYDKDSATANGISDDINVFLYGSEYSDMAIPAEYVGGSMYYDIAVLYVENSELLKNSYVTAVTFANSDKISVGDTAIAIGNAEGEGISASNGIVSVDSEHITMIAPDDRTEVDFRVMRIDTAVNSGNSGGGLFNSEGQLIGIVNAKTVDEGVENIGYAIPSNVALAVTKNIIDHCYGNNLESVQRCLLGITITISDSHAAIDEETGKILIKETVTVYEVSRTSIAYNKLLVDDILISISIGGNKRSITRQHHVIDYMLDARIGDEVTFEIERDGEILSTTVTITEDCVTPY